MPDTVLEGAHPRIILAQFGWDWLCSFRGEDFFLISSSLFSILAWWPSWLEVGITGHNFGRGPSKDQSTKVWLQLGQWFLRRRFVCEFPIGSYVELSSAVGAILVEGPNTFLEENHPKIISSICTIAGWRLERAVVWFNRPIKCQILARMRISDFLYFRL
jgi:hypothetical protein